MRTEEFNISRAFLEAQIQKYPENNEYLEAYNKLLAQKSTYDTEIEKSLIAQETKDYAIRTDYDSLVHTNNTNHNIAVHTNNTNYNVATFQNHTDYWVNESNNFTSNYQNTISHLERN